MTLAKNRQLLEQHKPESQRKALAMIAAANAPKAIPTPERTVATPQQQSVDSPTQTEGRREQAEACINALPDQFNLSEPMKVRYEKALKRAIAVATEELHKSFHEAVEKEISERLPKRIEYWENREAKLSVEMEMWQRRNADDHDAPDRRGVQADSRMPPCRPCAG